LQAINLEEKFGRFSDQWAPKIVAQVNDLHIKAVKVRGEFVWHAHADTDELFMVVKGRLTIRLRGREVRLGAGELFVVPKGVEHMPVAEDECEILLIEPAGTVNTGDAGGALTQSEDPWI
jgi:mannose-6-phosphate isomerase-like protein (cupin superfamily)